MVVAAACCASLASAPVALAQVGLGAERYEVTITPPKRPGSQTPPEPATPRSPGTDAAPGAAAPHDSSTGAPPEAAQPPASSAAVTAPGNAAQGDSATARSVTEPAAARTATDAPPHTLQVGAFRQRKSALSLRDALAASFQDVTIVEVQSGGEPLYRVTVGRLPHGAALDELRRRLVATGHPAFEIVAPPASAAD